MTDAEIAEHWSTLLGRTLPVACFRCKKSDKTDRHQLLPADRGGNSEIANLILLCESCARHLPVDDLVKRCQYVFCWLTPSDVRRIPIDPMLIPEAVAERARQREAKRVRALLADGAPGWVRIL